MPIFLCQDNLNCAYLLLDTVQSPDRFQTYGQWLRFSPFPFVKQEKEQSSPCESQSQWTRSAGVYCQEELCLWRGIKHLMGPGFKAGPIPDKWKSRSVYLWELPLTISPCPVFPQDFSPLRYLMKSGPPWEFHVSGHSGKDVTFWV